MPSHLTRSVFRRLLANEPLVHRGCLRRQSCASSASRPRLSGFESSHYSGSRSPSYHQSRTLFSFNMFVKPKHATEADMDPGIEEMMNLARRQRMRARLPPVEDVAAAFRELFEAKKKARQLLLDTQAVLALQSLRYCLSTAQNKGEEVLSEAGSVSSADLAVAADVLLASSHRASAAYIELARALYEAAAALSESGAIAVCLQAYVACLCAAGSSKKARELLLGLEIATDASGESVTKTDNAELEASFDAHGTRRPNSQLASVWLTVLKGFRVEENESELLKTLEMIKERKPPQSTFRDVTLEMLKFYMSAKDADKVKEWWTNFRNRTRQGDRGGFGDALARSLGEETHRLLTWCVLHKQLEFGHEVVRDLMKQNPPKSVWDAVFVWAAGTGKGADEINRMIGVMESHNKTISDPDKWRLPDSATINALVEFAISQKDPYFAERFISLGRERNIEPDAKTYVLQIDYRIEVNDVDGALIAYKSLQHMDTSSNEDLLTVNRLIVALCNTNRHDFDTIMNVAGDLSDRQARFEPSTVQALALLHSKRGEKDDVIDLLNTHAFHYSSAERDSIRDAMIAFITDPTTPNTRAWEAYTVIRSIFDETPRAQRTELMSAFFDRKRPDMAANVFLNMRQHTREDNMATVATYVTAFMGVAKVKDPETLDIIHNQLKLDFNINPTTQLRNSLIAAYTACDRAQRGLDFWDDIVASREGPSYNSLRIVLNACQNAPFGDLRAKEIWALLRKRGVQIDDTLWTSYIAALAGNGDNDLAISTLENAYESNELVVDVRTLAHLYMAAPSSVKQNQVAEWAKAKFPQLWAEVETMGFEEVGQWSDVKRVVGIDLTLSP